MIINCICLVLLIILCGVIFNTIEDKKYVKIPFKESIDLFNIPIVTFYHNGLKLRLMIDTGSDSSYLSLEARDLINKKGNIIDRKECSFDITAAASKISTVEDILIGISYNDKEFKEIFSCMDLKEAFKAFEGIKLHGILGSKFFKRYKYEIDFNKLIAKSKNGKNNKFKI